MTKVYKSLKLQWVFTAILAFVSITTSVQAFAKDGFTTTKEATSMMCNDVTDGGVISIGDNSGFNCNAYDPTVLMSISPSVGGSGLMEYQWLSSTIGCPTNIGQAIAGANSESYDPGTIEETTYFIRCSRREGCDSWFNNGESNCVVLEVGDNHHPDCGGTGGGDCASIIITPGAGMMSVAGLDEAPVSSLQVFTTSWTPVYSCFGGCDSTEILNIPAGDYLVFAKYYEANYTLICQIEGTFTVNSGGEGNGPCANAGGDSDGDGVCDTEDCAPNNPNLPAPLGASCDDGNANTINDVIVGNGCGCEGTLNGGGNGPDCNDISILTDNGTITVSGLDGAPISSVQVFTSTWSPIYSCFADCNATEVITLPQGGDYLVFVKYYQANYALICQVDGTYTVGGGNGGSNTLPTANDENETTTNATPVTVGVTSNDNFGTDGPNNGQIVIVQSPSNGTAVVGDNGTPTDPSDDLITYTPAAGYTGTDAVVYEITDSNGDTDMATLTITVEAGNTGGAPDCDEDISIVSENGAITVTGLDGAPVSSVQIFTTTWAPQYSCFADCSATTIVDLAAGDYLVFVKYYNADYTLICQKDGTFTVSDGEAGGNNLPIANDDDATTDEGVEVPIVITINDDFGADGPSMEPITLAISPNNGTVVFDNNGTPTDPTDDFAIYTPVAGFTGIDSFAYFISDSNGDITDATVTITVNPVTGVLNCDDISITTIEGAIVVSGLDEAPVSSLQVFTSTWQPVFSCFADCNATETVNVAGGDYLVFVKYYHADYTLNCQKDGAFTVGAGNSLPTANNDSNTTESGTPVTVNVIGNDNFGGDGPSNGAIEIVEQPSNGTASVNNNNTPANPADDTIVYTPNAGFVGQDQLTYEITDANGDTAEAIVLITVTAINGLPVASDDVGTTTSSTTVNVPVTNDDYFGTDGPSNGQILIVMNPTNGTAVVNSNGTPNNPADDFITYTPNPGFVGADQLTYEIEDADGDVDVAILTITVEATPGNPVANDDSATTDAGETVEIIVNTNDNYGPLGPNQGQIIIVQNPISGIAYVNNNGTPNSPIDDFIVYTPVAGYSGTDELIYEIADANGNTDTATITIVVNPEDSVLTVTGPNNQIIDAVPGTNNAIVNYQEPVANTTCSSGGANVVRTGGLASGATFPIGLTIVIYQATDACGNSETFSFEITVNETAPVCEISRTVTNATECNHGTDYGVYLQGNYYTIGQATFIEYSNGTAILTGQVNGLGIINLNFEGRTSVDNSLFGACFTPSTSGWYYYTSFSGIIGSLNVYNNSSHQLQVGIGANNQDNGEFGASGWFNTSSGYAGDINFRLSGNANDIDFDSSCPISTGCNNVTEGGVINAGNNPAGNCGSYNPSTLGSTAAASGGAGTIEYIWMSSTTGCPNNLSSVIPGATSATYNPGTITETTYFRRCARRAGCSSWDGESNCVTLTVLDANSAECNGGNVCDNANILFVVGNTTLNNGDTAIRSRLLSKGYTVMTVDDDAVQLWDANGKDLIIISSTVLSTTIGDMFRDIDIPVMNNEPWLYDDMGYTNGSSFGSQATTQITLFNIGHPLVEGLSGTVNIFNSSQEVSWGTPNTSGNDFGYIPGNTSTCVIIGWETGEQMHNIIAPARRVGFFLRNSGAAYLTNDGWRLFDNATNWLIGCSTSGTQALTAADDDILSFTAKLNANEVELNWANNTGEKNDYFVVEHSANGVDFEAITEKASATDAELTFYNVMDESPIIGNNFYRVQLMFNDGTSRYTDIKEVTLVDLVDFGMYPNPAAHVVNINLIELAGENVEIRMIDQLGRTVSVELTQATATPHQLNVSNLRNGRYMLMVITEGKKPVAKQLVIMND